MAERGYMTQIVRGYAGERIVRLFTWIQSGAWYSWNMEQWGSRYGRPTY